MENLKKIFLLLVPILLLGACESSDLPSSNDDQHAKLLKTQEMIDFEKSLLDYANIISQTPLSKEESSKSMRKNSLKYLSVTDNEETENKTDGQLLVEALDQHAQKLRELNLPK